MAKTIGILTSGGDAPGMNAGIRAVVRAGIAAGCKVVGIRMGYKGLLSKDVEELNLRSVSDIINRGGTLLYTARSEEFRTEEGVAKAANNCKELGIDGLIVIGGDGSFRGALELCKHGIPTIGIPGTIDNDIPSTDFTIGFDTAMNTAMEMVDKIRDTAQSHNRCSVIEVMGRRCGDIALQTGIAVGATAILVPEEECDIENDVISKIYEQKSTGKRHFIVVVAEGVENVKADGLAKYIENRTGIVSRTTILGYVQRGGSPTLRDRVMATRMGVHAVHLLNENIQNRVVCFRNGEITDMDIEEALNMKSRLNQELYDVAMEVSI